MYTSYAHGSVIFICHCITFHWTLPLLQFLLHCTAINSFANKLPCSVGVVSLENECLGHMQLLQDTWSRWGCSWNKCCKSNSFLMRKSPQALCFRVKMMDLYCLSGKKWKNWLGVVDRMWTSSGILVPFGLPRHGRYIIRLQTFMALMPLAWHWHAAITDTQINTGLFSLTAALSNALRIARPRWWIRGNS